MLRKIPIVLFLLLLTSCGAFSNLSKNFSDARGMISDLKPVIAKALDNSQALYDQGVEMVVEAKKMGDLLVFEVRAASSEFKQMKAAAFKKADKDGDGNLDLLERITYLVLLGGGAAEIVRRKMKSTQAQIAQLHGRVDHERSKRKS